MNKLLIYCTICEDHTTHRVKMGGKVCNECDVINPPHLLAKKGGPVHTSLEVLWIEFSEDGKFKEKHNEVAVGRSLLMSPFNDFFTWQTTVVTEILEERDGYIRFLTENSEYELYKPKDK